MGDAEACVQKAEHIVIVSTFERFFIEERSPKHRELAVQCSLDEPDKNFCEEPGTHH
jgi:hypothetical protein